jgi:hypothetical protein
MKLLDLLLKKSKKDNKKTVYTPPKPKMLPILMQDGTVEEYPENFRITDGKNCVVCDSGYYHTNLDCDRLRIERHSGNQVTGMFVRDARKEHYEFCPECKEMDKEWNKL